MKPSLHIHAFALFCGLVALPSWLTVQAQSQPRLASAPGPAQPTPAQPTPALRTYTPKAGESLDRVIANTLSDSPLKIELLRHAYMELNPGAFVQGKVPQLRKNVVLTVPNPEQLLKKLLPPQPSDSAAQQPILRPSSEERRRWVQYP